MNDRQERGQYRAVLVHLTSGVRKSLNATQDRRFIFRACLRVRDPSLVPECLEILVRLTRAAATPVPMFAGLTFY